MLRFYPLLFICIALTACKGNPSKPVDERNPFKGPNQTEREQRLEADKLYKLARQSLEASDYSTALLRYSQIQTRFPFTEFATQAQLESIYAQYRDFQSEEALDSAERFLREYPRHPQAAYVQYLRGLINYSRGAQLLDFLPGVRPEEHDLAFQRRSFDDFALLIQKYPKSRYAGDARQRMIDLRNTLAAHEMAIARFYVARGAPLSAVKRLERTLADYPGAPQNLEALQLLESSYRILGLTTQADDAGRILALNQSGLPATAVVPFAPKAPVPAPAAPPPEPATDALPAAPPP
ncbi:MAG: outer membrane protein assembly factor BamD [Pseudomonadota bacterium]